MIILNNSFESCSYNNKRSAAFRLDYIDKDVFFSNSEKIEYQRENLLNPKGRGKSYK